MVDKKQIEVELRSLLDKNKYRELKAYLKENAVDLGEDDKDVYFFLLQDKIVKVVNNISKKSAKIVIKLNRLGRGSSDFEEIEIPIGQDDFIKAVKMFSSLPFDQIERTFQKRHNYRYKGVELALKHSESWGYHLELEILVDDKKKQKEAERKIYKVAQGLGVAIMKEEEITEFARKIDKKYKEGVYDIKK